MNPGRHIDEIMERWDELHHGTAQIARSMEGQWCLDEAGVDRVVGQVLGQRWAAKQRGAA